MPSVAELANTSGSALSGALNAGIAAVSAGETFVFTLYVRTVLPYDGFVFWVRSDLVATPPALPPTISVQGVLHYGTDRRQEEDATQDINSVVLSTQTACDTLNQVAPGTMYLGTNGTIRFAFTKRGPFLTNAGVFHYRAEAVWPIMESQIIDDVSDFDALSPVVSNSLPFFLGLGALFVPPDAPPPPTVAIYPSFAVPENEPPPYVTAHVPPESTEGLAGAPHFDPTYGHLQLMRERVRLTFYGLRSNEALDLLDYVQHQSLFTGAIGFANVPALRDERRAQSDLGVLAQRKTADLEINYYQQRINDIARQLIVSAVPGVTVEGF